MCKPELYDTLSSCIMLKSLRISRAPVFTTISKLLKAVSSNLFYLEELDLCISHPEEDVPSFVQEVTLDGMGIALLGKSIQRLRKLSITLNCFNRTAVDGLMDVLDTIR